MDSVCDRIDGGRICSSNIAYPKIRDKSNKHTSPVANFNRFKVSGKYLYYCSFMQFLYTNLYKTETGFRNKFCSP
jgi:hypothetical protein